MRKTVFEWLDANRNGTDRGKKRRPKKPAAAATTTANATPAPPSKPRNAKRRKPK